MRSRYSRSSTVTSMKLAEHLKHLRVQRRLLCLPRNDLSVRRALRPRGKLLRRATVLRHPWRQATRGSTALGRLLLDKLLRILEPERTTNLLDQRLHVDDPQLGQRSDSVQESDSVAAILLLADR